MEKGRRDVKGTLVLGREWEKRKKTVFTGENGQRANSKGPIATTGARDARGGGTKARSGRRS